MDSVIFQAMAMEVGRKLAGSRLDKVVQISAGTLVMKFWTGQEKTQLLLKADGRGAFFFTREVHPAPARPPRFCQLLRARLRRLSSVQPEPLDRILHQYFIGPDKEHYDLILEAFGAQGNLILVDESGHIVDLLFREEGKRRLLPGELYLLPEQQERVSLFGETRDVVAAFQAAEQQGDLNRAKIAPMSPALAYTISEARRSGQSFAAIITRIREVFQSGNFSALRVTWNEKSGLLPLLLGEHSWTVEDFPDLSALVEAGPTETGQESAKDLAARISAVIRKQRKRLEKRLEHIATESERQADPERFRVTGDLLLANLHRFKRGDLQVEVEDYYQSPSVTVKIELDSKLMPQENAERHFKLYRKAKRSTDHHNRRQLETSEEMEWLDQVELSLEEAATGEDLYQVQLELETAGMLKQTKGQLGRRQTTRPEDQLYKTVTPGGWPLYWGKNSRTNDYVSRHMTGTNDLWFHAKGMAGTHLVLKCGENVGDVTEDDTLFAASIAAGYSKGKNAGKVEVIVARGRDVKKPKGARTGLVTVDSYRSVMVIPLRPDPG